MFGKFWNWLRDALGFSGRDFAKVKDEPKPAAKPEPEAPGPKVDKSDPDYPIASASTWMQMYEERAEAWENDQRKYMAALEQYGRTGAAEAIMALDWAKIMRGYKPATLTKVFSEGTLLSLQGHPDTKKVIQAAAKQERARRNKGTKAPTGHGMDPDGKQK